MSPNVRRLKFPPKARALFARARYKIIRGGRGSAKSHSAAALLLIEGVQEKHRILCCREYQVSIKASVHQLLCDKIQALGLSAYYRITDHAITGTNGTEFLFGGLKTNTESIKSMEGITRCLVEEAQSVSKESWEILIPTIRAPGSEFVIVFNPKNETDDTYQRFVVHPPPDSISIVMNWRDNPYMPAELEAERLHCLDTNPDDYDWIWEGLCRKIAKASIYGDKVSIQDFVEPDRIRPLYGVDWGFSTDPTVITRAYIQDECLWITHAEYGYNTELDDTPALFEKVPGSRKYPLKADCARPESISHLKRKGFNISAAAKWPNCIEDRIAHIRSYRKIIIHTRCKELQEEARKYSFKVDRMSGDVLPDVVDAFNHGWDSTAYSLDGYIKRKGTSLEQWIALNK